MKDFKDFLVRLQTLDIKITTKNLVEKGVANETRYYDISHQNPFLSPAFKNEMKQLKEHAITDILNLPKEQVLFQLQRLNNINEVFRTFWNNFYNIRFLEYYKNIFVFGLRIARRIRLGYIRTMAARHRCAGDEGALRRATRFARSSIRARSAFHG